MEGGGDQMIYPTPLPLARAGIVRMGSWSVLLMGGCQKRVIIYESQSNISYIGCG